MEFKEWGSFRLDDLLTCGYGYVAKEDWLFSLVHD